MQEYRIDIKIPSSWQHLSDKQLRFVYKLIASEFSIDEIKTLCLFKWGNIKMLARKESGEFILQKSKVIFEVSPLALAEILPNLDWLASLPPIPFRLSKINRCKALPADFEEVPFEKFIMADNLYQGYLATENDSILEELASVLYGKAMSLTPPERISVFYWMASLKEFFSRKYSEFFQPIGASDGNLLGSSTSVEDAMNAQIRALTKGDITKESEILSLDTWRALTELNAQAREYKEINSKLNTK